VVYAVVNLANAKLAKETESQRWISPLAAVLCIVALCIMVFQFAQDPATRASAYAVVAVILLALVVEVVFRALRGRGQPRPQPQVH
jgi:L-asparagine transporter-like permease